jgi:hypothetical protein
MFVESGGLTGKEISTDNLGMGLLHFASAVLPGSPENDMLFIRLVDFKLTPFSLI